MSNYLIAPKALPEFTPDEYHAYVTAMYALRVRGAAKPKATAPGLSLKRTAKGALSITWRSKVRPFAYVTMPELIALAAGIPCSQADLWNAFKRKRFIIAKDRLEAEQTYAKLKEIPW